MCSNDKERNDRKENDSVNVNDFKNEDESTTESGRDNIKENSPVEEDPIKEIQVSIKITQHYKYPSFPIWIIVICSFIAVLSFPFLGYFFPVKSWENIVAMGIGAVMFMVLITCIGVLCFKYIDVKGSFKKEKGVDSERILYETYKEIFKK